jgi:hypothetical protein
MEKRIYCNKTFTARGFKLHTFEDSYKTPCSFQESSNVDPSIWLGVTEARAQVLATRAAAHGISTDQTCGWVPYPLHPDLNIPTRMHLTRSQAHDLAQILLRYSETGVLL